MKEITDFSTISTYGGKVENIRCGKTVENF